MVENGRVVADDRFHLRYEITDAGKTWVDRCMKYEASFVVVFPA